MYFAIHSYIIHNPDFPQNRIKSILNTLEAKCVITNIENYEKALQTIKQQLEDIKNGEFDEKKIENSKNLMAQAGDFPGL